VQQKELSVNIRNRWRLEGWNVTDNLRSLGRELKDERRLARIEDVIEELMVTVRACVQWKGHRR
jgi:hypothetical protein